MFSLSAVNVNEKDVHCCSIASFSNVQQQTGVAVEIISVKQCTTAVLVVEKKEGTCQL